MDEALWSEALEVDGSLRDIVVQDVDEDAWDRLLDFVARSEAAGEVVVRTEPSPLPEGSRAIFALAFERRPLLAITLGQVDLNFRFFDPEGIELDLDPGQFTGSEDVDTLRGFIRRLGSAVGEPVLLTPEGGHDVPYVIYDPPTDEWHWWRS
ncbi:MAG: hypothetical protein KF809_09475 [Chloroflexi bacterium]|nr:hypothetical protein [Chloroflexota bacterium]